MAEKYQYDIVIIGGGPAGAVSAIAAARQGADVLLVEQNGYLGGALTGAGVGPQMTYHAGRTQVVRGIPEEIVKMLVDIGASPGHMDDFVGYASSVTPFDPEGLKYVLETMAQEAGVHLLYHTVYTGCAMDGDRVASVRLFSKNGFFDVYGKVFIDCSADADLAAHAGVPCTYGRDADHLAQPMTMNVRVTGVDREKVMAYTVSHRDDMYEGIPFERLHDIPRTGMLGAYSVIRKAKEAGDFPIDRDIILCFETNRPGEFILNMSRISKKSAVDPLDLTYAEIEGRRQAREIVSFLRKYISGFENCSILTTGPNIGIRESRRIIGRYVLTAQDLLGNVMFPDAVAMGGYPIDIHAPDGEAMQHYFLKPGSWYSVPYRSLVAGEAENLIVAGRCISVTHEACAAVRVTPIVMAMGQAAGSAAAQSVRTGEKANALDTEALRDTLRSQGAFLEEFNS